MIIAGIQDGHIALILRGLAADSAARISVERFESTAPFYTCAGFFLGLNGHIRVYVKSHPGWEREDLRKIVQQFVEMEIAAHPNLAGPPIAELEIDKGGRVHWIADGRAIESRLTRHDWPQK